MLAHFVLGLGTGLFLYYAWETVVFIILEFNNVRKMKRKEIDEDG
jgi:hypothetical protein